MRRDGSLCPSVVLSNNYRDVEDAIPYGLTSDGLSVRAIHESPVFNRTDKSEFVGMIDGERSAPLVKGERASERWRGDSRKLDITIKRNPTTAVRRSPSL